MYPVDPALLVGSVGVLYLAYGMVLVWWWVETAMPVVMAASQGVLFSIPGITLTYVGYWMRQSGLRAEFGANTLTWTLAGVAAMGALLAVYHTTPGQAISSPEFAVPLLTGLAAVAGSLVGINNARAHELDELRSELESTIDNLEEANARLEHFAYAASHDLTEPLRMISSYLQLLERRYGGELDDEAQEFLGYAIDGANRSKAMVDGLLEYSRIDSGGQAFKEVALDDIVEGVQTDLQIRIDETAATVSVEPLPKVRGDPDQLSHVFQNLLENALMYTDDDPPAVQIWADSGPVSETVHVRDHGIGIHPDDQDRVFDLFYRGRAGADTEGSGVGLSTCQRIIERHDGTIEVASEPGDRTTFSITLPGLGPGPSTASTEGGLG